MKRKSISNRAQKEITISEMGEDFVECVSMDRMAIYRSEDINSITDKGNLDTPLRLKWYARKIFPLYKHAYIRTCDPISKVAGW